MAHFSTSLTPAQLNVLNSWAIPQIFAKVEMRGYMLVPISSNDDRTYNFTTTEQLHTLDLTNKVRNKNVVVKESIPVLPSKDGKANNQGRVRLQIDNSSGYFSTISPNPQGGQPMLSFSRIQDYVFTIYANAEGIDPIKLYTGKPIANPEETEDATIFDLQSILWDIIDTELVMERMIGGPTIIDPTYYVLPNGQIALDAYEDAALGVSHYHGISYLDEFGVSRSAVENTDPDKVTLRRIDFQTAPTGNVRLGLYTIKFRDATNYELTMPDSQTFQGSINANFDNGYIVIQGNSDYWTTTGEDLDGVEITFQVFYNIVGNPIAIIKNLLYKALTQRWGQYYLEDTTLPIDFTELDRLEGEYGSNTLYVSATNYDNDVFDPVKPDKPLRIKDFCQIIADHIGCQLAFTTGGKITLRSAFSPENPEPPTYQSQQLSSGNTRKGSHRIFFEGKKYDITKLTYGYNPFTKNYAGNSTVDVGSGATKKEQLEIGLPYYKIGVSDRIIAKLATQFSDFTKYSHVRLEMMLLPQIGLTLQPGDILQANFTTQPILPDATLGDTLGKYWRIYEVDKRIGDIITIRCSAIPKPEEDQAVLCDFVINTDTTC